MAAEIQKAIPGENNVKKGRGIGKQLGIHMNMTLGYIYRAVLKRTDIRKNQGNTTRGDEWNEGGALV